MARRGGRAKNAWHMPEEYREKIAKSQILRRLIMHAEGTVEMSPSQVTAAIALLRKCIPDLMAVDISAKHEVVHKISRVPLTREEWAEKYAALPAQTPSTIDVTPHHAINGNGSGNGSAH